MTDQTENIPQIKDLTHTASMWYAVKRGHTSRVVHRDNYENIMHCAKQMADTEDTIEVGVCDTYGKEGANDLVSVYTMKKIVFLDLKSLSVDQESSDPRNGS